MLRDRFLWGLWALATLLNSYSLGRALSKPSILFGEIFYAAFLLMTSVFFLNAAYRRIMGLDEG